MGFTAMIQSLFNAGIAGTGLRLVRYPLAAAGIKATTSNNTVGKFGWSAANAKAVQIVAKATFTVPWRIMGFMLDTLSILGIYVCRLGTAAGAADAATVWMAQGGFEALTLVGSTPPVFFPYGSTPTVNPAPLVDALVAELASSSASGADDTANVSVFVQTVIGS